jgi:hypothetical protein
MCQLVSHVCGGGRDYDGIFQCRMEEPNQAMKPTAPYRVNASNLATTPCRGLSLSR